MSMTEINAFHSGDSVEDAVRSRIHFKMRDYASYRFSASQSCAINIFFDLSQEFGDLEHVWLLSVLILRMFFFYDAELYLRDDNGAFVLTTPPVGDEVAKIQKPRSDIWQDANRCYIPVRGKGAPLVTKEGHVIAGEDMMGVLVVYTKRPFAAHDLLFLEKYANRVGFSLHNKILALRNEHHVLFLRKLAHDMGHNIITPNMRLKLMLKQMASQVSLFKAASGRLDDKELKRDLEALQAKMAEQIKDITGNFTNSALFLESLLRQTHFDQGRFVLRRENFDLASEVVVPQFEIYRARFEERQLAVINPVLPSSPCIVCADLGLLSQVMSNYLSNAVKYTRVATDGRTEVRGEVTRDVNAFGKGKNGFKVSVFSSGPPIAEEERNYLFTDNFRASNAREQVGTGHGLFFAREIIIEHQGTVAYSYAPGANVFSFTLPAAD